MALTPTATLSENEVKKGLKLVIVEGLTTEVMTSFTGGAFLVALALLMGASNAQIGLLAALPTFTHVSQLISIALVNKFNNRRAIAVFCSVLARIPLVIIGVAAFFSKGAASVELLIFILFFYYLFGSIAGPSWNSWMKDLVPEKSLGGYFATRSRYTQMLNVFLSILLALALDYIKLNYAEYQLETYATMFIAGGLVGLAGSFLLSRVPEPLAIASQENLFRLFKRPLKDNNFIRLLIFNAGWVFALNIATPFFTVFMLRSLELPFSYIIGLGILSQVFSILTIRTWGIFADRYSNKTIISISAPLYIFCIIAWCFVGIYTRPAANLTLLVLIHIFTGIATAGVNLSVTNMGLKLAPKQHAIVYLSTKNIVTSFFASIAPLIGGQLADFFMNRSITIDAAYAGPEVQKVFHLLSLHEWNFLFLIGAFLALLVLELLVYVKEVGEVEKDLVVRIMRHTLKHNLRDFFLIGTLIGFHDHLWEMIRRKLHWKGEAPADPGNK